jgi:hypothetical protein
MLGHDHLLLERIARATRDIGVWGTVLITVYSGWSYVQRAVVMYRRNLLK